MPAITSMWVCLRCMRALAIVVLVGCTVQPPPPLMHRTATLTAAKPPPPPPPKRIRIKPDPCTYNPMLCL
jgi:hypothetical protein